MKITLYLSRKRGSLYESCEIVKYFQEGTCVCSTKVAQLLLLQNLEYIFGLSYF